MPSDPDGWPRTEEELAEAAQVSQRAVSDLERGVNATARKDTAVG
jgi:transcriptional regulator with XRE-family HTH domain